MNVLIIGHKSHGKDEAGARLARLLECQYLSSSLFMCERAVLPTLAPLYEYTSVEDCYADRDNHREEWFNLIYEYNRLSPTRTADELLKEASIYVGMRNRIEFNANMDKGNFDVVLWVEAGKRKEKEPHESMELTEEDADYVVDNNGSVEDLQAQLVYYASLIRYLEKARTQALQETFSRWDA